MLCPPRILHPEPTHIKPLEANGRRFVSADANVDVPLAERVAAGEADHAEIIEWLEARTIPIA